LSLPPSAGFPNVVRLSGLRDWPNLDIYSHHLLATHHQGSALDRFALPISHSNRSSTVYSGILIGIVKILAEHLNLTYSWVANDDGDQRFGGLDPSTGKPFGLFKLLAENKTDVLLGAALMNFGRSSIADSTYPHQVARLYLVTR
jgi:hypothetical protein